MNLKEYVVFDSYYKGLKLNGWSKDAAAKAARRHVRQLAPRALNEEFAATGWTKLHQPTEPSTSK